MLNTKQEKKKNKQNKIAPQSEENTLESIDENKNNHRHEINDEFICTAIQWSSFTEIVQIIFKAIKILLKLLPHESYY